MSAIPAYAEDNAITFSELKSNIDLILPPESAIDPLAEHTYWQETDRDYTYLGIEATYQALYDDYPQQSSELPTIYTYVIPYASEDALQGEFSAFLDRSQFQSGEWILLTTGVNNFSYKTGAGSDSDLFMYYSSESNTLHYVEEQDNLLIVVNFFRGGGDYRRGNVLAYEEYIEDEEGTVAVLKSVASYIRESVDFFLDDITPVGPPAEYDHYMTSSSASLNLDDIYGIPKNGSISFDVYLDDTSEIGTIFDMSGISEAEYGSLSLGINENALLDFNFYDPFTVSECGDSAGWHHLYTEDSIDLYDWTSVKIEYGESIGMKIFVDNVLQGSCEVYRARGNGPIYLGDYPEDIIEESFVGYIKNIKTTFTTDGNGTIIDEIQGRIFSDVGNTHDNAEAIEYLYEQGIIGGYEDGTFRPDQEVNRVEILKMLLLGFGYDLIEEAEDEIFTDVDYKSWYAPYLITAYDWGIIDGYDDGTYQPGEVVNRVEFLKILTGAYGISLADYPIISLYEDTEIDAWYAPYVQYSKDNELFDLVDNYFYPGNAMTRGETAEAIYRMLQ